MDHFCYLFSVCHAFLSVHCSLVVTCWGRANLLALLCVMFSCVFVTYPCGVLGQVWYKIILIPGLWLLTYFPSEMIAKLKYTQNTAQQNKDQTLNPHKTTITTINNESTTT